MEFDKVLAVVPLESKKDEYRMVKQKFNETMTTPQEILEVRTLEHLLILSYSLVIFFLLTCQINNYNDYFCCRNLTGLVVVLASFN